MSKVIQTLSPTVTDWSADKLRARWFMVGLPRKELGMCLTAVGSKACAHFLVAFATLFERVAFFESGKLGSLSERFSVVQLDFPPWIQTAFLTLSHWALHRMLKRLRR